MTRWQVIVVGAGPAGLMAAARAAERGRSTLLLERNRQPGAKILLSGGTRCNLTHATDCRGIVEAFGPQGRFLHSALAALGPQRVVELFEAEGVPTKVEEGGKVFPASDRAADVCAALVRRLVRCDGVLFPDRSVRRIERTDCGFRLMTPVQELSAEKIILATGGTSYPKCGTTGDGYGWAAALGHTIVTPCPALVPVISHAPWAVALQGITVPEVLLKLFEPGSAKAAGKPHRLAEARGAVLFTHFGLSGPAVLDISRWISRHPEPKTLSLQCDFLPAVKERELAVLLRRECGDAGKRHTAGIVAQWVPRRLAEVAAQQAGMAATQRAAELSKADCQRLAEVLKRFTIPVAGTLGLRKAEVTAGGVSLDEVDSRTMQSKLVPGLFFAGELLDLDGPIGGYNFQAAFSTGWLAGESV